jgi:hypothetical protein
MQEDSAHVAIRGVVPIVADAMSVLGNRLSVGQDRLLRTTLTTPVVTADLVRRALQEQMTELAAVFSASISQRPRMLVVVTFGGCQRRYPSYSNLMQALNSCL